MSQKPYHTPSHKPSPSHYSLPNTHYFIRSHSNPKTLTLSLLITQYSLLHYIAPNPQNPHPLITQYSIRSHPNPKNHTLSLLITQYSLLITHYSILMSQYSCLHIQANNSKIGLPCPSGVV